jgi:uncharacterized protein (DUF362 family)
MQMDIGRRSFLKKAAMGTLTLGLGMKLKACRDTGGRSFAGELPELQEKSRIALVRHEGAMTGGGNAKRSVVQEMVDTAILRFTGKGSLSEAWKEFVSPDDFVGIKVNALTSNNQPCTNPEVVNGIVRGLLKAGVPENNIIIWDRSWQELEKAGYPLNMSEQGVRCFGTNSLGTYRGYSVPRVRSFFRFNRQAHRYGQVDTKFSRIFADTCTALINVPVLKDHRLSGITFCMKNMYGCIDNPGMLHDNGCDPYIADLNALPIIRARTRLHIGDCLRVLYQCGTSGSSDHQWNYGGILLGTDPVALDYTGWGIIEDKRTAEDMVSLEEEGRAPNYIHTAGDPHHRLGHCSPDRIILEQIQLGSV